MTLRAGEACTVQALGGPPCVSASPALAQTREGAPFPTVHPQLLTSIPLKADFVALIRLYQEVMREKKCFLYSGQK